MNQELQLKLQAFLDGELPEREAREILALTQRDAEAAALLAELKNTRQAMTKAEPHLSVPESREFYWSKIQREIEHREPRASSAPAASLADTLRRLLLSAGALAALAIAVLVAYPHFQPDGKSTTGNAVEIETTLADADAVTYRDEQESTTLVWLSYPAATPGRDKPAHS